MCGRDARLGSPARQPAPGSLRSARPAKPESAVNAPAQLPKNSQPLLPGSDASRSVRSRQLHSATDKLRWGKGYRGSTCKQRVAGARPIFASDLPDAKATALTTPRRRTLGSPTAAPGGEAALATASRARLRLAAPIRPPPSVCRCRIGLGVPRTLAQHRALRSLGSAGPTRSRRDASPRPSSPLTRRPRETRLPGL